MWQVKTIRGVMGRQAPRSMVRNKVAVAVISRKVRGTPSVLKLSVSGTAGGRQDIGYPAVKRADSQQSSVSPVPSESPHTPLSIPPG